MDMKRYVKESKGCPDGMWLGWLGVLHKVKCRQFDSRSGHLLRLQVQSPIGAHVG